ncbi:macro domain-containing protein [Marinobacter sp. F4206]|nr:macro domain-containing protein [Marinobacter sp. F4206]
MDAVVNAANARLMPGSGVAGAIHGAAGPGLAEECQALAPISPGEAVISSGHRLPNRHVIHCLGPVYGVDEPSDRLLGDCYRNALAVAEQHRLNSVAFPAISTGVFGYPVDKAAAVAIDAIAAMAPALRFVQRVRLVLFSDSDRRLFQAALSRSSLTSTD